MPPRKASRTTKSKASTTKKSGASLRKTKTTKKPVTKRKASAPKKKTVKTTRTTKKVNPYIIFKSFDLGIAVALVIAALAFSVVVASAATESTSTKPIRYTIETFEETTTGISNTYQFRAIPRQSTVTMHSITEGENRDFNLKIVRPSFRSRYALYVKRYTKVEEPKKNSPPLIRQAREFAQDTTWRRIPITDGADFVWTAGDYADADSELSNTVDIIAFAAREYVTQGVGQSRKGLYLKDFAIIRYQIDPSSPTQIEPENSFPGSEVNINIKPSIDTPQSDIVEAGKPNTPIMKFDIEINELEDVNLKKVDITLEALNKEANDETKTLLQKGLKKITLTSNGKLLGSATPEVVDALTLHAKIDTKNFRMKKSSKHPIQVEIDTADYNVAGSAFSGLQFRAKLKPQTQTDGTTSIIAEDVNTNKDLTQKQVIFDSSLDIVGETMTITGGILEIKWKGDTPNGFKNGGNKQIIGKFEVIFNSFTERPAKVTDIDINLSSTMAVPINRTVRIYRDSVSDNNILATHTFKPGEKIEITSIENFVEQGLAHAVAKDFIITLDTAGANPGSLLEIFIEDIGITWTDFDTAYFAKVKGLPLEKKVLTY